MLQRSREALCGLAWTAASGKVQKEAEQPPLTWRRRSLCVKRQMSDRGAAIRPSMTTWEQWHEVQGLQRQASGYHYGTSAHHFVLILGTPSKFTSKY